MPHKNYISLKGYTDGERSNWIVKAFYVLGGFVLLGYMAVWLLKGEKT